MRACRLAPIALLAALCTGCGAPSVDYVLVFPALETFLLSANATVSVYGEADKPDEICRNLNVNQAPGKKPDQTSGKRDVCEFEEGLSISGVDVGRLVMFAEVEDKNGDALMRGCKVVDLYADTEAVKITLSTLPDYPVDPELSCASVKEKCDKKKACDGR